MSATADIVRRMWEGARFGIFEGYSCDRCDNTRIVEEPVFGRFAAEATRPVPCPACCAKASREDHRVGSLPPTVCDDPWSPKVSLTKAPW